jgi:hypothetical protein
MYSCNTGANEIFSFQNARGTLCSANLVTREPLCLRARGKAPPAPSPVPPPSPDPPPPPAAEMWPWAVPGSPLPGGWSMPRDGTVRHGGLCLTAGGAVLTLSACSQHAGGAAAAASTQRFNLTAPGNLRLLSGGSAPCVAVESGSGPGLVMYSCNTGANEIFSFQNVGGTLCSANLVTREPLCLRARGKPPPVAVATSSAK